MNKRPKVAEKSAIPADSPYRQDPGKPISFPEKDMGEESLKIWESTQQEFQSLEKKQKENWSRSMSYLLEKPEATSNPAGGHIGHYGDFSFGEDGESYGGGCSEGESNEEVEEPELVGKRKYLEGDTSDESSDGRILTNTKKRKLGDEVTTDELLLPDSDSSTEEGIENEHEQQKAESRRINGKNMRIREASQSDSLSLDDEDGEEEDWNIPEELKVKPAEEYHSDVVSDDELVHRSRKASADTSTIEKEKLMVILRWINGKKSVKKKIIVLSKTKFKNIKHMAARNFKVQLKMVFDGEVIKDSDTAESLGLEITLDDENADLIDCLVLEELC